ncbi:hypothetical protein GJ744_005419 [Endocarpon pusillum]|uniref:Uncharacterized protein n=1 Tax=Endocarpon pusillum TaxID=364733 RepID=A0A8H7ACA7_9EURO|nr:hypothetical protein GJ744_005419 [Endocarpon pusillum]
MRDYSILNPPTLHYFTIEQLNSEYEVVPACPTDWVAEDLENCLLVPNISIHSVRYSCTRIYTTQPRRLHHT